jgi:hypothetical protein
MSTLGDDHRSTAIEMMKHGAPPEQVHAQLVAQGAPEAEVHAFVSELVRLKREAEARDPARLREQAKWMFVRGASVDDVVRAFEAVGVAAEHARPEAERILAVVRTMRPCQRCGTPIAPSEALFDPQGRSICVVCHSRDEISRSEQRGVLSAFESIGMSPLITLAASGVVESSTVAAPAALCAYCHASAMVHVSALAPAQAAAYPGASWVCPRCGAWTR